MTLTEFLLARYAEEKAHAYDEFDLYYRGETPDSTMYLDWSTNPATPPNLAKIYTEPNRDGWHSLTFRVHADPARVLADVQLHESLLRLHAPKVELWWEEQCEIEVCSVCDESYPNRWPCATVRVLTLSYADRPDYQQEWAL